MWPVLVTLLPSLAAAEKQNKEKTLVKNGTIVLAWEAVLHPPIRTKTTCCKAVTYALKCFSCAGQRAFVPKTGGKTEEKTTTGTELVLLFILFRNLIFKHAIRSIYGLSAACKVNASSLPAECQPLPTGTETGQCCCQKIGPSLLWGRGGRGADQLCCCQTNQLTCMYASDKVLTLHTESLLVFN